VAPLHVARQCRASICAGATDAGAVSSPALRTLPMVVVEPQACAGAALRAAVAAGPLRLTAAALLAPSAANAAARAVTGTLREPVVAS
jgi:hypothetical protein